jgi:hypothetical protein
MLRSDQGLAQCKYSITSRSPRIGLIQQPEFNKALRAAVAAEPGGYLDVHCWVFTEVSFAGIMAEIAALGLTDFSLRRLYPTRPGANEFVVFREGRG